MAYWWVNQNQTYAQEVRGGYLWSPKRNTNNNRNAFYDNMTRVQPGDVVLSFADTLIKAVGIAQGTAQSALKPTEFGAAGANWGNEGWLVPVAFTELRAPIRPKDHIEGLRPTLPATHSPLQANGNGNQGAYLAELPEPMAAALANLLNGQVEQIRDASVRVEANRDPDAEAEAEIEQRADIPETEKQQLVMARRGQGLFRTRVELFERACRITGLRQRAHLRASHIKPWRNSTDVEKLDGQNGLLLSPACRPSLRPRVHNLLGFWSDPVFHQTIEGRNRTLGHAGHSEYW